jgi:hypothetical protein
MKGQKRRCTVADLRKGTAGFLEFGNRIAEEKMLYKLGRLLQIVGLIVLPLAIAGNLAPEPQGIDLRTSLTLSALGIVLFGLGYLLQQMGRK